MDMAIGILVGLTFGGILMYWGEKTSDKVISKSDELINKLTEELKYCYSLDQVLEMENKWVAEVEKLTAQLKNTRYAYSYRRDKCKELENRVSEFEEVT